MAEMVRITTARELQGRSVRDATEEPLGRIEDVLIDCESGRVAAVVITLDGVPDEAFPPLCAIPWEMCRFDEAFEGLRTDLDRESFLRAPRFESAPYSPAQDPGWLEAVYEHYGQLPYWRIN